MKFAALLLSISALWCNSALAQGVPIGALPPASLPLSGSELTVLQQNGQAVQSTVSQVGVPAITIPADTILGNNTAASAKATGLTPSQINTMLGLGTAAFYNVGTSGANIPVLNSVNTWSALQNFSGGISLSSLSIANLTVTSLLTYPSPFTLGSTSVTTTGTQFNYLSAATGTTGTTSTNLVFSGSPTIASPTFSGTATGPDSGTWASGGINGSIIGATTPEAITGTSLGTTGASVVFQKGGVTGTFNWAPTSTNKSITLPNGTTDFTATGGTSQVLQQASTGAAFTVGQLACASLSNGATGCSTATGTSGATIPLLSGTNTWSGVQTFSNNDFVLGGASTGKLTMTYASTATTGTITWPAGTTNFSSTGGTSQVLQQVSTGAAFTVGQLACASLSNGATGCSTATGTSGATIPLLNAANTWSNTQSFAGSTSIPAADILNATEACPASATAATGTINFDFSTQSCLYYTSSASANWTLNFRFSSGTSFNTAVATGKVVTGTFWVTQGASPFFNNVVEVDGATSGVTTKWFGGAPSAGNASGIDIYTYAINKTGSATYTIVASLAQAK